MYPLSWLQVNDLVNIWESLEGQLAGREPQLIGHVQAHTTKNQMTSELLKYDLEPPLVYKVGVGSTRCI